MIKKFKNLFEIFKTRGTIVLLKSIKSYFKLILFRNIFNTERIICKVNDYKMILFTNDRGISRSLMCLVTVGQGTFPTETKRPSLNDGVKGMPARRSS